MANERTPLRRAEGGGPPYVFMTNPNKLYRKQIHQFQCFICSLFLLLFTTAVVISVLRSVEEDTIDNPPSPLIFDNSSIEPLLSMSWPIDDKGVPDWQGDMPNEDDVVIALIKGQQSLQAKDELEKSTKPLSKDTASYKHQKSIKTSPRAQYLSRTGYVMDVATKTVISKGNNTNGKNKKTSIGRTLRLKEVPPLPAFCSHDKDFDCEQTEYRSVDGSCNNIKHPSTWGVAMQPFRRILPPDYADGVSSPRTSSGGTELPSAREVSVVIHRPEYRDDPKFTVMLAVWGQFLDHDISATALSQGKDGSTISCCDIAEEQRHPECFPVRVGSGDPYFNVSCLEFVRSAPAPICSFGPREQLNQASSYIDGSVVYGNTQELSSSLRSYQSGQLRMTVTEDGRELLPISTDPNDGCNREEESSKGRYCFASGDARANENMHLTTMHLIMARQHNNLASQLAVLNPTWNDERIYQESRKIVAAQMQHITYNEFLPVLIGPQLLDRLDLLPEASGYSGSYDDKVDASVGNSFATASFRFAHTLLPGVMKLFHNSSKEEKVELHNMLFNPYKLYSPGYIDSAVLGAINTPLERMDNYFNKEVTEKLFKQPNKTCGLDLVSLNVQRGRDHGLPAYPEWREHCGLSKPTSFDDLKGLVDDESLKRISELYKTVDDVDLYTGALSEYPLESGMLGATLTCLIGDQFMRLKIGDRYWYETSEQPQAFTPEQLAEIRKTSLAQLICDNADNVTVIQPRVMESIREGNTRVSCDKLEQPNLVHWTNFGKQKSIQKNLVSEIEKQTIAVKVKSGFISSDDSSNMWDGSFPLIIPTKYFSHKKFAPENFDNDLAYEAFVNLYKIQWNGKLSKADGKLMFSGTFTFPYLDFSVPFSPSSLKSINGKFLFLCDSIWNNTDAIDLSGSYSSPIFFSEKSFNLTNVLQFVQVHPHLTSLLNSTEKVPIILNGSYSLDSSSFSWDGNALIRLPLQKVESIDNKLKISNMKSNQTTVGFKVTNGNIKLTSADGFQETIWSGNFPVDMSNPIFHLKEFSRLQAESPGSDVSPELFQYGITWTLLKSGPKYQGKFTMPLYNYTKGYSIIWMNGEFDLDVLSTSEMTMENAIEPGMKYVSRVIFREEKIKSLPSDTDSMESNDQLENLKLFLADSASAIDGAVPAPIILDGSFSPDKKIFHWSGEGAINIRSNKKYLLAETIAEQSSPIWTESRYGCSVQGGFIKDVSGREINLTPPIDIPMASIWSHDKTVNSFSYSSGINWSGILSGNVLKGSFSFPQFGGDPVQGPFVQWKNGTFSFQLQPLWDSELESLLMPGGNYFSKIAFQGSSSALDTSSNYKMSNELSSTIYAPIILQGQYSLTKDVFTWNGNLIISFRGSMNRNYNFVTDKKVLQLTDSKPGKTSSRIKISTGSLSAGSTTQEMPPVMWEGDFPVKIDVDSLLPPNTFIRSAEVTWSGEISSTNLNGVFSVPIYDKKGISTLYTGNFSFDYTTAWSQTVDTLLKANKKYVAKVFFSDSRKKSNYAENSNIETSSSVSVNSANKQNLGAGSSGLIISLLGYYYSKPFFCPGFICNNEKLFYWSGDAIISVANQQFVLQKSTMFTQASMQFGGRVIHGQLNIHNSKNEQKVWEGMLPAEIPTELMMMPQAKKMFVEWYGNYSESILQGVFTIPEYEMFNSTLNLMGDFKLMIEPLWFASLENILVSGRKYVSQIYLQGDEKFAENNYKLGEDTLIFVPIILQGDYSADKKVFLWNGNFIISVRTPSKPANEETVRLMAIKDSYVTLKPTKSPKPTKAPKPTKPPKPPSPIKLSVSLTVISGLVSAGFENMNATEVWNGAPPVSMTLDNVLEEESYTTSAQATWSGTVDKTNFEGTFSVPTTFKNETDTTTVEWKGSFSVKYMVKWSGNLESFVKPGKKLTCKVLFKEFGQKSTNPNSITNDNYSNESFKKQKASKPEIDIDSLGPPTACNIILVGTFYKKPFYCKILPFFCTDSTIFTWNGEAILSYSFPPPVTTTPKPEDRITVTESPLNELKLSMGVPFTPYYTHQRVVIGKVVSGYMKAGLSGESKKMLWSGSVPTVIPFPVFWAPVSTLPDTPPDAYSHGVIWSGSAFGSTVDCSFKLPQYISNGAGSSMRWWNGNLRVHIQSLWTTGIGGLIIPGVKYYSRVVFRESKKYSETNQLTPTQDEINSAYEAPLILLGNYSADRKMFYWSGNFILVFRDLPSPYTYDLPPAAISTISDPNTDKKPLKQVMDGSKDSSLVLAKQKSIVAKVLTGTIVAGLSPLSKQTIWSGALPAEIPLSVFWLPSIDLESVDTDSYSHGVIWSGAVFGNTVQCSFYLPQHTLVEKSAGIRWWKGDMSLKIESAWDIGLAQMIAPGLQYSSRVSFGDEKNITKLLTSAPSQDKIDSSFKAPITLIGKYSPDKKTFYWSGSFVIKFHSIPGTFMNELMMPIDSQNMKQLKFIKKTSISDSSLRKNLAVIVKSGFVTKIGVGNDRVNLWSGEMPTTIPLMNVSSNMIVNWTGSIQDSVLLGEYSTFEVMKGQLFSGQFSLNIDPMWNSTFDAFIAAGKSFTSKLIMRELHMPSLVSLSASAESDVPLGAIILLGQYSPDRSFFTWFGQAIVNVY